MASRMRSLWAALCISAAATTVAQAQGLDSLNETEVVGYCATFYLAKMEHFAEDDAEGTIRAEADGFVAAAASVAGKTTETMTDDLSQAAGMMRNFFRLANLSDDAKTMVDQSEAFCRTRAPQYPQTIELFQ